MNLREALLYEIDRAPDEVLNLLLLILRMTNRSNPDQPIAPVASKSHHYPLRGLPLEIAEDFDDVSLDEKILSYSHVRGIW